MKKSIKRWMKKIGCTVLATAVMVCSIPNQVYVYSGQIANAEEINTDYASESKDGEGSSNEAQQESAVSTEEEGSLEPTIPTVGEEGSPEVTTSTVGEEGSSEATTSTVVEESSEITTSTVVEENSQITTSTVEEGSSEVTTSTAIEEESSEVTTSTVVEEESSEVTTSTVVEEESSEITTSTVVEEESSEVITSTVVEEESSEVTTSTVVEESSESTSSEDEIGDEDDEDQIKVKLVNNTLNLQEYRFDKDAKAWKAYTAVEIGIQFLENNEIITDVEKQKQLLNDYRVKIEGLDCNIEEQYYEFNNPDNGTCWKTFFTNKEGNFSIKATVVKKDGDTYTDVVVAEQRSVSIDFPELEFKKPVVSLENAVYEYNELDNTYKAKSTAKVTADIEISANAAIENEEATVKTLLSDYELVVTDNKGGTLTDEAISLSSVGKVSNHIYQVSFSSNLEFANSENGYQITAKISKKDGSSCPQNISSNALFINIPVFDVNNNLSVEPSLNVNYLFDQQENKIVANLTPQVLVKFTIQNAENDSQKLLTKNVVLIVEDENGNLLTGENGISLSEATLIDGVYCYNFTKETVRLNVETYSKLHAKVVYKPANGESKLLKSETREVTVKLSKLAMGDIQVGIDNFEYVYNREQNKYLPKGIVRVSLQYEVTDSMSQKAVEDLLNQYTLVLTDNQGNKVNENIKFSSVEPVKESETNKQSYTISYEKTVWFDEEKSLYEVYATVQSQNKSVSNTKATREIQIPKLELGKPMFTNSDVSYLYDQDSNTYSASTHTTASVSFEIKNEKADCVVENVAAVLTQDYRLAVKNGSKETVYLELAENGVYSETEKVYKVAFNVQNIFAEDQESYEVITWLEKKNADGNYEVVGEKVTQNTSVKIPRINIEDISVTATVSDVTYIIDSGKDAYYAVTNVQVKVSYPTENIISAPNALTNLAQGYLLQVVDCTGEKLENINAKNLSDGVVDENGICTVSFSKSVILDTNIDNYTVTATVLKNDTNIASVISSDVRKVAIPTLNGVKLSALVISAAKDGESQAYFDKATKQYFVNKSATLCVTYDIDDANKEEVEKLLNGYFAQMQVFQKQKDGNEQCVGEVTIEKLNYEENATVQMSANITLKQDGELYAVGTLRKDNVVVETQTMVGPTIQIPRVRVVTDEVVYDKRYNWNDFWKIDKWFTLNVDAVTSVNYEILNFVDDTTTLDDNNALDDMLKVSIVKLQLLNQQNNQVLPLTEEAKSEVTLYEIKQRNEKNNTPGKSYQLDYHTTVDWLTEIKSNIVIDTPNEEIQKEGGTEEVHVPSISIEKANANINLSSYTKNAQGVYEADVTSNGSIKFKIIDCAPNDDISEWKTASDAFYDQYKVDVTLKQVNGDTKYTVSKEFTEAEKNYNKEVMYCELDFGFKKTLKNDGKYITEVTVYYKDQDGNWQVLPSDDIHDEDKYQTKTDEMTVGNAYITFSEKPSVELKSQYKYNPATDKHSYVVTANATLTYNLATGTANKTTIDNLLADYEVCFGIYNGTQQVCDPQVRAFTGRDSENSINYTYSFETDQTLDDLNLVVTTMHTVADGKLQITEASNKVELKNVIIPDSIELQSTSAPNITIVHDENQCSHVGKNGALVDSHMNQVDGKVVLTFKGSAGLDVSQRAEEIRNRVSASYMTVFEQVGDTSIEVLKIPFNQYVEKYEISKAKEEDTYQLEMDIQEEFLTYKSGSHVYYSEVVLETLDNGVKQQVVSSYTDNTHLVEIAELPQNFAFEPKQNTVVYAQDLTFKLTQESDLYEGAFTVNCYQVIDGKKEAVAEERVVVDYEKHEVSVNTESVGAYYIEFTFAGNPIYEKTTDSTTFTVNKAPITTVFNTSSKEFTKSHALTLSASMDVANKAALKRYMADKDIMVEFVAVPKDSNYKAVKLAESKMIFDDQTQQAIVIEDIPHSVSKKLNQETEYILKAEIKCGTEFPYVNENVSKDNGNIILVIDEFKVNNLNLIMSNDGMTMTDTLAYERPYKASEPTYDLNLRFYEVQNNYASIQEPIKVTYTSSDESVATVDANGIVTIHTAGSVDITVVADDATEEQNVYNTFTGIFKVTVVSPSDTRVNLSVNGTTVEYANIQSIYDVRNAYVTRNGKGVYWYDEDIVVTIPEGSEYNKICYTVNNGSEQVTAGNTLVIDNELVADYKLYLIHDTAKLNSLDASADNNVYKELNNVAVDKKAPAVEDVIKLTSDGVKSEYSNETLEYYNTEVSLTVDSDGTQVNGSVFDYQSGVKEIKVEYGKDGTYVSSVNQNQTYADDACYFDTFLFGFDKDNFNYHTVKVTVVDNMNHETEVVFRGTKENNTPNYGGTEAVQICVDTNVPDLVVKGQNADTDILEKEYEGEWTDEQVNYSLSVADLDQVVSGIRAYQYAVLEKKDEPTGEVDLEKLAWKEISADKLEVLFGIIEEAYDDTVKDGSFVYTSENGSIVLEQEEEQKSETQNSEEFKLNGTVYFRAISNSGLIGNVNKEIKIWQTEMDAPNVYANNKPAATGWYNAETGKVTLRFEYPKDYKSDKNAPTVSVWYKFVATDENGGITPMEKKFEITDVNLTTDPYIEHAELPVTTDSMNVLEVYNLDEAGNKSEVYKYILNADYNAPVIENINYNGQKQVLYEDGKTQDIVYTLFTQKNVDVTTSVTYGISKKESLKLQQCKTVGEGKVDGGTEAESLSFQANTRGFIYATATDMAGNQTVAWADGFVVDDQKPGGGSQGVEITAPAPNSEEFYSDDIPLKINVSDVYNDDYSGLKSVTYSISCDGTATKSGISLLSFPDSAPTWTAIKQYEKLETSEVIIDAESNEGNEVVVRVNAIDNALNEVTTEKTYMIDITKPEIKVTFDTDNALNEKYYNKARTAKIEIVERNFDASRVKFVIMKDGVEVKNLTPTSWTTNEMSHTATISFAEDGDYSFTVDCTDLADNEAESVSVDEFTIDLTKPEVEVAYDQDTSWKDNYFGVTRTATITVTEHNFNAADFTTIVEPHVALSNWTHNGDTHRATLSFTQDNHYTLNMEYTDLAGNTMEPFTMQDFYIDTQVPEISLSGVEDRSANAGVVVPVITATDTNYDVDGLSITLTDGKGASYIVERVASVLPNGYQYTLSNINDLDDQIYTLSAVITDKAGNSSEISCRFSLNRNGSTYDLREITELVEKKYVRYADIEGVHVSEMNVDKIEKFSIYMNKAGEVLTKSQAGPLPSKLEADVIYYDVDVLGNDETGYEYVYTLYRENFESEGIYNLMFYSKDRAGNEVNNTLTEKGAEITFVVDNTAPTVVIDGIEGGEFYAEEYRDVNVYVSDYTQVVEALFYLVDEDGVTVETYDYLELAENVGDVVTIRIPSNDKSLHLDYTARDIAGNEITTIMISDEATPTSFMITTNKWLQLRNNETALTGIIIGGVVVVILIPVSVLYFRRKRVAK